MQGSDAAELQTLVALAAKTAAGMQSVAEGKAPDTVTQSNVATFAGIAKLLNALSARATERAAESEQCATALRRIANLQIRSGAELLEAGNWKRIATELQSIAQDAVAKSVH